MRSADGDENPAEDKDDLETVLRKFDSHYAQDRKYCAIKREAFLDRVQMEDEQVMDFVADIKFKNKQCEYGPAEESVVVDKIIHGMKDRFMKIRLLELEDQELTLDNAIRICRIRVFTQQHMYSIQWTIQRGRGRASERSYDCGRDCDMCEKRHAYGDCPARDRFCGLCGQQGHFQRLRLCQSKLFQEVAEVGVELRPTQKDSFMLTLVKLIIIHMKMIM
ncbi:uncharacterized protein LOC117117925 [Anneissia japonica]|uniref:uncharacterized protein LOC117117925 n=1 Tax=Anneissia japonica TaxID=1529436 RepID=UPI0014255F94|nr:uncharacterized protein LOC117117925 [Anneissia japonica]